MCDTMGFFHEGSAIFAKNSDRSPNEPQVLEYIPAKDHEETELKVTYTTIPQVPHTKAILISRPVYCRSKFKKFSFNFLSYKFCLNFCSYFIFIFFFR